MVTSKAVKLVKVTLDFNNYLPADDEAIRHWLRSEIGNTNIAYDLLEVQVEQLVSNRWAVGRLYLTEKRLGVAA